MTALDRLIPAPRLLELDEIDLALSPARAYEVVRHGNLATSRLVRALFAVRTLPERLRGKPSEPLRLKIDDMVSSPEQPGFALLIDEPPHELAVGAIGKVWQLEIPFVHVADAPAFLAFASPDHVKVAWALRIAALGEHDSRLTFELRVDATDDEAWRKFQAYFRLIGPGSHFIRRSLLATLEREHGSPEAKQNERALPGDELLSDAADQLTHAITIAASPAAIWPWLVQMGCRRGGFYSYDALDNAGKRSAREIHPELQQIAVGDVLPASSEGHDGFEVLQVTPGRALVLGGLYDAAAKEQLPFTAPRPPSYWHVTWSFVLEPLTEGRTRLLVRARAACPESGGLHLSWMGFVHHFMERAQLRRLAARVEGRLPRDDAHDVWEGLAGAALMLGGLVTPFLRARRVHWGLTAEQAERRYPGDALVPEPRWGWTHAIEVDAPAHAVWPFLAQLGAGKAGFYSYQWLENLAGCNLHNAEVVHPEWEAKQGDTLVLHPAIAPLVLVEVERGHHLVAFGAPDPQKQARGEGWVSASWLLATEPLAPGRCRVISRYRAASADDFATRLAFGPALNEPVGFAMDRKMLLGIKERAEQRQRALVPAPRC